MIRLAGRLHAWRKQIAKVRRKHLQYVGRPLRLFPPRTFGDKIEWRKLFDADPAFAVFCNKLATRDYVAARVGRDALVPLLWSGNDPAALPLETLPRPFIVKCTHDSGFNVVVTEEKIDAVGVRAQFAEWLTIDYGELHDEPAYSGAPRALLVEPFLRHKRGFAPEYRIFVFDGVARVVLVRHKLGFREAERTNDFFTLPWRRAPVRHQRVPSYSGDIERPGQLDWMVEQAQHLAEKRDHLRVDFLVAGDRAYVGELTPYTWSGHACFDPPEYDLRLGAWWRLERPVASALWAIATRDWGVTRADHAPAQAEGRLLELPAGTPTVVR